MADQSGGFMMREYRKGNWTLNETMVLIEAKKMDDERRMRRSIGLPPPEQQQQQQDNRSSSSSSTNKPAELRWKWIEDYCWRKGCMRSQNQCNDKWDNLMRDYKKVREYERRRVESSFTTADQSSSSSAPTTETASYWKMEKSERKERNLPSNMLPQTYQALFEVVEGKTLPSSTAATAVTAAVAAAAAAIGSGNGSGGSGQIQKVIQQSLGFVVPKHFEPPVLLPLPPVLPPPPPSQPPPQPLPRPLLLPPPPPPPSFHHAQPILPTKDSSSDSDTSEYSDTSPAKRRRTMPTTTAGPSGGAEAEEAGGSKREEETTTTVAVALSRSASVIANAIRESEERKDRRHKEVMSVEERRLKMEETNVEINRQGMNGLVEAINKLASSIFALASSSSSRHNNNNQHQGGPPP